MIIIIIFFCYSRDQVKKTAILYLDQINYSQIIK